MALPDYFPTMEPSVGCMLEAVPHVLVQAAQFGRIDELRWLLDNTPELINQANDRGMTALMAAAHGGHAAVVTMLLERRADVTCQDDRGVSALDYAIRENKQEVARALLDCGAKVNALKKGLNIKSATMLAKIGAEKGIMLSGMTRGQTKASFVGQNLQPADVILIASDLQFMAVLTELGLGNNKIGDQGATAIAKALKSGTAVLTNLRLDNNSIGANGAKAIAEALKVNPVLTSLDLRTNSIGNGGAMAIAEALKVNPVLTILNLDKNSIGDDGAKAIVEALKVNPVLTKLDLRINGLGDAGEKAVREAVKDRSGFELRM